MTLLPDLGDARPLSVETVINDGAAWIILRGEADIAALPHLETALTHVELDGAESVHLHLHDLDFADVATLRRLTIFAKEAKQAGRDINTCGAKPTLLKVARLLSVHDDLGLA